MKEGEVFTKILRGSIRPRVGKLVARWVLGVAAATLAAPVILASFNSRSSCCSKTQAKRTSVRTRSQVWPAILNSVSLENFDEET